MGRRSIKDRVRRATSPEARRQLLTDWTANWRADQMDIVRQLEEAIRTMDYDDLCSATGQLKAVTEKRFAGLESALLELQSALSEESEQGHSQ